MSQGIEQLIRDHTEYRLSCLNMIASENRMSKKARKALSSDLAHRYHADFYGGSKIARDLIETTSDLICQLFHSNYSLVTPLSGNVADLAAIFALTKPGDLIASLPLEKGGYPLDYIGLGRKWKSLPYSDDLESLPIPESISFLEKEKPSLVVLGASFFLFPHPVKEISEVVHSYGGKVVYDGSHVLGLIAGGQFQDPLNEGADLMLGSTHKSLPGPQGGVILYNDDALTPSLTHVIGDDPLEAIFLVDNIHLNRVAALGIVAEEMLTDGEQYAKQVVLNSKALGKGLDKNGVPVKGANRGYSEFHQVLGSIQDFDEGAEKRDKLGLVGIIIDAAFRFGTQELTRLGFDTSEMFQISEIVAHTLDVPPNKLKPYAEEVQKLVQAHTEVVL